MRGLDEIRQALAQVVEEHTGIKAYAYAEPRVITPCVVLGSHEGEPATMDGSQTLLISLFVLIAPTHEQFQQDLDALVDGDRSICAAIDAHPDLGLDQDVSAVWTGWGGYGTVEWSGSTYWSVRVDLELIR